MAAGSGPARRAPGVWAAALCLVLVAAGGETGPRPSPPAASASDPAIRAGPDTTVVGMTNALAFTPDTVTVTAGETVVWRNGSVLVHTVTAVPDSAAKESSVRLPEGAEPFGSGRLEPDATFRHTFSVVGAYRYFCIPHEAAGMVGTVIVEPEN